MGAAVPAAIRDVAKGYKKKPCHGRRPWSKEMPLPQMAGETLVGAAVPAAICERLETMPKSAALRKGRFSRPGFIYLVTATTAGRKPVFRPFSCGLEIARSLHFHHVSGWVDNLAWVVMPDHVHWLFALKDKGTLSQVMRSFKAFTARRINQRAGQAGRRLWQPGYHDHAIRKEEDLRAVARYVIANPLRAGLVEHIGDYPLWYAAWV